MNASLFTDFLQQLGVKHTKAYSDQRFATMPFQSMFGLSSLLTDYGIANEGLKISDKSELAKLTPPFLAETPGGFVIVTGINNDSVSYLSYGEKETAAKDVFTNAWTGVALLAFPTNASMEPGYQEHRVDEFINGGKKWLLWVLVAALFAYLFVSNKIYSHWSTILLTLFNIQGLILTFMLVQKTLRIKDKAADAVCGVLQEGGCDHILELKASSFFGIFKWSEVGFAYFSVSLLTLLIFPEWTSYLAACNVLCLPFTLWSIWYQKFRAKFWCTLCVSVQATLWLLFVCYLCGGWLKGIFPLRIEFLVLGATYVAVLLALNRFDSSKLNNNAQADTSTPA